MLTCFALADAGARDVGPPAPDGFVERQSTDTTTIRDWACPERIRDFCRIYGVPL